MLELTAAELDVLLAIPTLTPRLAEKLRASRHGGEDLSLNPNERDSLLETVSEHLATHGFDAEYRPTPLGSVLERVIDRLTTSPSSD